MPSEARRRRRTGARAILGVAIAFAVVLGSPQRSRAQVERDGNVRAAVVATARDAASVPGARDALARARRAMTEAGRRRGRRELDAARRSELLAWAYVRLARARIALARSAARARAAELDAERAEADAVVAREALALAQAALVTARRGRGP